MQGRIGLRAQAKLAGCGRGSRLAASLEMDENRNRAIPKQGTLAHMYTHTPRLLRGEWYNNRATLVLRLKQYEEFHLRN